MIKYNEEVNSLEQLGEFSHNGGVDYALSARVFVFGIDLSDLGYAQGARVEGLFFQDMMDDDTYVDPVFIAGLRAIE